MSGGYNSLGRGKWIRCVDRVMTVRRRSRSEAEFEAKILVESERRSWRGFFMLLPPVVAAGFPLARSSQLHPNYEPNTTKAPDWLEATS
jgi:hypothetical protein